MAELAINNRDASSISVNPFFLTHGYHVDLISVSDDDLKISTRRSLVQQADDIVRKLK